MAVPNCTIHPTLAETTLDRAGKLQYSGFPGLLFVRGGQDNRSTRCRQALTLLFGLGNPPSRQLFMSRHSFEASGDVTDFRGRPEKLSIPPPKN